MIFVREKYHEPGVFHFIALCYGFTPVKIGTGSKRRSLGVDIHPQVQSTGDRSPVLAGLPSFPEITACWCVQAEAQIHGFVYSLSIFGYLQ